MSDKILVDFHGPGSGVGELTWGQRTVWRTIVKTGVPETMGGIVKPPEGTAVEDAVMLMRFAINRHQSLRTRLCFTEDGEPRQVVSESGTAVLDVVEANGADPDQVAADLKTRYETTDFDYVNDWPVRMGVVLADGKLTHSVVVYSHLAIDAHGLEALLADVVNLDPATGEGRVPVTATQPLELAEQQSKPNALRNSESALRYWEKVLRTVSPRRVQATETEVKHEPRWGEVSFSSPAIALATKTIAARLVTDTSPILLAGYAVALARTIGNNPVALQMAVNNRFRQALMGSVCTMAQTCPLMIDIADISFAEAVGRSRQAAMVTYKYAYYNPEHRAAMVDSVKADLGGPVEMDCYFNDRRPPVREQDLTEIPTAEEILAARSRTSHEWVLWTDNDRPLLYLDVDEVPDAVKFTLTFDSHRGTPDEFLGLLTEIESVLVEAALDPDARTGVPR